MSSLTVLITGGTSGIGRACALAFGKAGYQVAVTGRDSAKLHDTAQALKAAGVAHLAGYRSNVDNAPRSLL